MTKKFTTGLLKWHETNQRDLPWKKTSDPYKIWLSEIILQQTRVEQGIPYYYRLTSLFPTVYHLAKASEDEVMRAWQGLGYYTRARNLHAASKQIANEYNGRFPDTYEEILKLKGVGTYTAAAISSFAFDKPHAVVDGNVQRVLARAFGINKEINSAAGKKEFSMLANKLIHKKNPSAYNQAIMDFGSLVCAPVPACSVCFYKTGCFAYNKQLIKHLPVKTKKIKVRTRYFLFFVFTEQTTGKFIIERREDNDIWKGLYQFPLVEMKSMHQCRRITRFIKRKSDHFGTSWNIENISPVFDHKLTHQVLKAQFILISIQKFKETLPASWMLVSKKNLEKFGLPKLLAAYSEKYLH